MQDDSREEAEQSAELREAGEVEDDMEARDLSLEVLMLSFASSASALDLARLHEAGALRARAGALRAVCVCVCWCGGKGCEKRGSL